MKTNKSLIAILTSVMFAIFTLAFVVRAQSPALAGNSNTASVVVPSVLPDSLPIGSEQVMLDWAVTNRQWSVYPLMTSWDVSIRYTGKDNNIHEVGVSVINYPISTYQGFEDKVVEVGNLLLNTIRKNRDIDPTKGLSFKLFYGYDNDLDNTGVTSFYIQKDLGLIGTITDNTFRNMGVIWYQSIVRFKSLERVEINIDSDPAYNYVWPSGSVKTQSVYPIEGTTSGYHVFRAWYSTNAFKARFKITASGETATYTQIGNKLKAPSVKVLSDRAVEVSMTPGSHTVVETSTDMVNWSVLKDIPWNLSTESQTVLVYPPNSPHRFFRAWSE